MTVTTEQTPGWPWPIRANVTRSVERYFQSLQRQGDFNRQLARNWVAEMASTSRAVGSRTQGTRHPPVGHRDLVAEHPHAGDEVTSVPAAAESTELSAEQNLRRNDLFDSLLHSLIEADILVTTR